MQKLNIEPTPITPAIRFSPDENVFFIRGKSSPEDVRALYHPVREWTKGFVDEVLKGGYKNYNSENPLRFQIDLTYFNSSSAKFFFDILKELKKLPEAGFPVNVEWYYEEDDSDMKEAGDDISLLVEMGFTFIEKPAEY